MGGGGHFVKNVLAEIPKYVRWIAVDYARGRGRSFSKEYWDTSYRSGKWDYLKELEQLGNRALIAAYLRTLGPGTSVLELGCGEGLLLDEIQTTVANYVGVDISQEAVARAHDHAISAGFSFDWTFKEADFETFQADELFDAIVFSESLYYADTPRATLARYFGFLEPSGIVIVSMYRYKNTKYVWKSSLSECRAITGATVKNSKGQTWDVRVLVPKSSGREGE